ncbi:MAG: 50S ribosomal protein L13 [Planctomycetes bacterium]|jgi:large subunit ribosomal protein L13|nr:50S ribosomal protein L13 [Planctomycetota bacterium]MBT6452644.1 50S ribosomal protein L13 [Planctomycetota bacterium]MBT6541347.1 50S ribosomal protein L13 [Planctomycetota bacterium]MBT6785613.1 50S ribosomal protein L13 [Planctomycetota bacterium]MBT6967605.1 50S ribosomal protein L13 [Planctomycetota bacterium]
MQKYSPQRTFNQRKEDVVRQWYHVDASEEILGHMAVEIARILMGKNKPTYTPHVDGGDFVVVTNAREIQVSGEKREKKLYYYHTGYMGGLKSNTLSWMLDKKPEEVIRLAVRRMLPKTRLGRKMLSKLKVFAGAEHSLQAQQSHFEKVEFTSSRIKKKS